MNKLTVLLAVLPLLVPAPSLASEPYDFASAVIRGLQTCRIAGERIKTVDTTNPVSVMAGMLVFTNEIRLADTMIASYRNSEKELIRESADNISFIYKSIVKNNEETLSFFEKTFNDPKADCLQQHRRDLSDDGAADSAVGDDAHYARSASSVLA